MGFQCPVCGCTISTEAKLVAHVDAHFHPPQASATDAPPLVQCTFPGCSAMVSATELDAHEDSHRRNERTAAGTGLPDAQSAPAQRPASQCVLCPLGCGQWIPLTELDDHEQVHMALAQEDRRAGRGVQGAGSVQGTSAMGNQDLLQQLQAGLAAARTATQAGGVAAATAASDEDLAVALQWLSRTATVPDSMQASWAAEGAEEGYEGYGEDVESDVALAARLQEEADFERLQAQYGFSDKRPGRCHICGKEGHWSRDCPSNPHAARNQPRLPTSDPATLAQQQRTDPQFTPHSADISDLLATACLRQQQGPGQQHTQVWLCGTVLHFATQMGDRGWGCGWRNMQMQISHSLLRPGARHLVDRLFGGRGIVPDIGSLQAWLEVAWKEGYDTEGAESLGHSVQGETKWVGTTEAAALLAYQGVATRVVDFKGVTPGVTVAGEGRDSQGRSVHTGVQCDICGTSPIVGIRHHSLSRGNYDLCSACVSVPGVAERDGPFERRGTEGGGATAGGAADDRGGVEDTTQGGAGSSQDKGSTEVGEAWWVKAARQQGRSTAVDARAQAGRGRVRGRGAVSQAPSAPTPMQTVLLNWVWRYFTGQHLPSCHMGTATVGSDAVTPHGVVRTGLPPLYFQHAGHSRTIIGIERRPAGSHAPAAHTRQPENLDLEHWSYTLLILDPSTRPNELQNALRSGTGWQRLLKRGPHTLKHTEYQLLYCLDTPLDKEGQRMAKIVRAAEVVQV